MKIAIVQIESSSNLEQNLKKMESYTEDAAKGGADLVVFPEMAYFTGPKEAWLPVVPKFSELKGIFQSWSTKFNIALCPGSIREPVPSDASHYYNTLLFLTPEGKTFSYKKIFLYEAVLPDKIYEEGKYCTPGNETVVIELKGIKIGFAICFDLRFPEIFRSLKKKGAEVVVMPSAFTVPTGQAHWDVLVRARAIENQFFMMAPDLCGISGDNAKVYGHSIAVNPWGEVLTNFLNEDRLQMVSIETKEIERVAAKVAGWKCRREDLFPIA